MNQKELVKYINGFKEGEEVIEHSGCMSGCKGITYISERGDMCILWTLPNGDKMGTSFTASARRPGEENLK